MLLLDEGRGLKSRQEGIGFQESFRAVAVPAFEMLVEVGIYSVRYICVCRLKSAPPKIQICRGPRIPLVLSLEKELLKRIFARIILRNTAQ